MIGHMELQRVAQKILPLFSVPDLEYSIQTYGNGHINDTFLISSASGHRFILQRISPAAFHHPDHVMDNMMKVTSALRGKILSRQGDPDREALSIIPLHNGAPYLTWEDGAVWRMTKFIPDTVSYDLPENESIFCESGRAFGRFACDLADYPADTLFETIPHFHDTPDRLRLFRDACQKDAVNRAGTCQNVIKDYLDRAERSSLLTGQLENGTLPVRVTHNDTKLNNVLLDSQTLHAVCVIDLDTVMPGLFAYDFGDAIRFGASTALEDERDTSRIHFSLPMFKAFAQGYLQESGNMLSPAEIDSLPVGAWMMTYECGMRFLTDYLAGDVYFHVASEDHNLVRAINQMTLLKDMEKYEQAMSDTVHSSTPQA